MTSGVFFRQQGSGPAVVCLHSNAATSGQWRSLMELLAPCFRVIAADLHGAGKSPPWPEGSPGSLAEEFALLAPVFESAGERFALVGHSYGAAVALKAALALPGRVTALALYEPTLFALADRHRPPPNGADGIKTAVRRSLASLADGREDEAARHFIDFWITEGAWASMPESRKPAIRKSIHDVGRWAHALVEDPIDLHAFAGLEVPVLLIRGSCSPKSGYAVTDVLREILPRASVLDLEGLGHMGPITDPEVVNAAIGAFLQGCRTAPTPR